MVDTVIFWLIMATTILSNLVGSGPLGPLIAGVYFPYLQIQTYALAHKNRVNSATKSYVPEVFNS